MLLPVTTDTRFAKTVKGVVEIRDRLHGLPPRARQLLILINGRRTYADLCVLIPERELVSHLMLLEAEHFVTRPADPAAISAETSGSGAPDTIPFPSTRPGPTTSAPPTGAASSPNLGAPSAAPSAPSAAHSSALPAAHLSAPSAARSATSSPTPPASPAQTPSVASISSQAPIDPAPPMKSTPLAGFGPSGITPDGAATMVKPLAAASAARYDPLQIMCARVSRGLLDLVGPAGDLMADRIARCQTLQELRELMPAAISIVEALKGADAAHDFVVRTGRIGDANHG